MVRSLLWLAGIVSTLRQRNRQDRSTSLYISSTLCYRKAGMRVTRHVWLVRIVAVSIATTWAFGPASGASSAFGEGQPGSMADVKITKFHLVETKGGKTLWEVWGDRGEIFEKTDVAKVMKISNPVTVVIYSEEGKLTVRSDSATLNTRTKNIHMEQNVTAISEEGNSLQTQSLDWLGQGRRGAPRSPVTLIRGGLTSWGVGMEAEVDLERAKFLSRVRSHMIPGSAEPATKAP